MDPFPHTYHPHLNLVEVRPAGMVRVADIVRYGRALVDEGFIREGTVEYADLSGVDDLSIDFKSANALVDMRKNWLRMGWRGTLYYAPLDVQFGIVRMVGAMMQALEDLPGAVMVPRRVPTPLDQVREILQAQRGDGQPSSAAG